MKRRRRAIRRSGAYGERLFRTSGGCASGQQRLMRIAPTDSAVQQELSVSSSTHDPPLTLQHYSGNTTMREDFRCSLSDPRQYCRRAAGIRIVPNKAISSMTISTEEEECCSTTSQLTALQKRGPTRKSPLFVGAASSTLSSTRNRTEEADSIIAGVDIMFARRSLREEKKKRMAGACPSLISASAFSQRLLLRFIVCWILFLTSTSICRGQDPTEAPAPMPAVVPFTIAPRPLPPVTAAPAPAGTTPPVTAAPTGTPPVTAAPTGTPPVTAAPAVTTTTAAPVLPSPVTTAPIPAVTKAPTTAPATIAPTTLAPTALPSSFPTKSPAPTISNMPSVSAAPSISKMPSSNPTQSMAPSGLPSSMPSPNPTFAEEIQTRGFYSQGFKKQVPTTDKDQFFNDTERAALFKFIEGYTAIVLGNPDADMDTVPDVDVDTICQLTNPQKSSEDEMTNRTIIIVDYDCQYISRTTNVKGFPARYADYVNANLNSFTAAIQEFDSKVYEALPVEDFSVQTPSPTASVAPSLGPTLFPTLSVQPSVLPTGIPSQPPTEVPVPTTNPAFPPMPTAAPVTPAAPTAETEVPTMVPDGDGPDVGLIAGVVIAIGLLALVCLYWYYWTWKKSREQQQLHASATAGNGIDAGRGSSSTNTMWPSLRSSARAPGVWNSNSSGAVAAVTGVETDDPTDRNVALSPTDSLLSNKSLLSEGDPALAEESGDEVDGTNGLQDEFDQYRDQNVENLRDDVEKNVPGFEAIISNVITNALMGDEETNVDMKELLWGCNANPAGTEIEASALFEVCDWLKRNESAFDERKRAFMQEILHKMVTSVRYGVLRAQVASRTIHEAAAILGLELAEELPMRTVIISGMSKMTTRNDMIKALHEFGEIGDAAVASGRRGFGLVRFKRNRSVDLALQRYKSGEIVILDVSIQMQVLMPSGAIESR